MKLLTQKDLIKAGYQAGPNFPFLLARISELEAKGITDKKYALKLLKRQLPPNDLRAVLREKPLEFTKAIIPETDDEKANFKKVSQKMNELLRSPIITAGTILPDACPAGNGDAVIPVGGAVIAQNAIIPSAHSADICCSMYATFYEPRSSVSSELDALITATRFGPGHRHMDDLVHDAVLDENVWDNPFLNGLRDRAHAHIADQGDGNHFAYLGEVTVEPSLLSLLEKNNYSDLTSLLSPHRGKTLRVLVTHHGSRGLGAHVYKRGQNAALKHTDKVAKRIPNAAAWIDASSPEGIAYWDALQYVARWTKANHRAIHSRFIERIQGKSICAFGNEHNFVWKRGNDYYHGKGATPAWPDSSGRPQMGLIPLNMAEPILWVLGKDNPNFLSFAPHGAGRNLSRTALKRRFPSPEDKLHTIEKTTTGLDIRWFSGKPDISETPIAYKNAQQVIQQIQNFDLATIVTKITPLGCIMAGEQKSSWQRKEEELTPKQIRQIGHRAERRKTQQQLRNLS